MSIGRSGGGVSGTLISLVAFVFLSIVAIVLAIMFYSKMNKTEKLYQAELESIKPIAAAAERESDAVKKLVDEAAKAEAGRSVVTHLSTQMGNIKRLVVGSDDKSVQEVQQILAKNGVAEGVTVLRALDTLRGEKVAVDKKLKAVEAQLAEAQKQMATLTEEAGKAKAAYDEAVKKLAEDLAKMQGDNKSSQEQTDGAIKQLQERSEAMAAEYDKSLKTAEAEINKSRSEIIRLKGVIEELIRLGKSRPDVPNPGLEVDGLIIAVDPDRNLAYINIGGADHLVLGMTFEVFDPVRGPQVDDSGRPRGVATLEVVDMSGKSAACRVVRSTPGRPVLVNDQIVNAIYDRTRVFKFYIFGEFDLDGDEQYTIADRDYIETLIRSWGGQIVQLSERQRQLAATLGKELAKDATLLPLDTDFLVVGREPELPKPVAPDAPADIVRKAQEEKARWDQFIRLVNEAKGFSVPVLNQNRFLTLIGYYRR